MRKKSNNRKQTWHTELMTSHPKCSVWPPLEWQRLHDVGTEKGVGKKNAHANDAKLCMHIKGTHSLQDANTKCKDPLVVLELIDVPHPFPLNEIGRASCRERV